MNESPSVAGLAAECAELLEEAHALLERIPPEVYKGAGQTEPAGIDGIGAHLRHCLDCFSCLFSGVESGRVDYDRRRRDASIETDAARAGEALDAAATRLRGTWAQRADCDLEVRIDERAPTETRSWLRSSLARELRFLVSHTLHHFAVISLLLSQHGVRVDPNFALAPATAEYRRQRARPKRDGDRG